MKEHHTPCPLPQGHSGSGPPADGNHAPHYIKRGRERDRWRQRERLTFNLKRIMMPGFHLSKCGMMTQMTLFDSGNLIHVIYSV